MHCLSLNLSLRWYGTGIHGSTRLIVVECDAIAVKTPVERPGFTPHAHMPEAELSNCFCQSVFQSVCYNASTSMKQLKPFHAI